MGDAGKRLISAAEEAVVIARGEAQPERTHYVSWEGGITVDRYGRIVGQWSRSHLPPPPNTGKGEGV